MKRSKLFVELTMLLKDKKLLSQELELNYMIIKEMLFKLKKVKYVVSKALA